MWRNNPYEDEWHDRIERMSSSNDKPFNAWFGGQNRIYLPFERLSDGDTDIIEILEDEGYEVVNYREGHCRRPGKNIQRIGKVLNNLKKRALKELKARHVSGEIYNIRRELPKTSRYYDNIIKQFSSSSYRGVGSSALKVVISQDPHDLAKMSTERDWESCMTLPTEGVGGGAHYRSVIKEVENGGFIAYLIYADDLDIVRPLSRVHIRRFDNNKGESFAKVEQSVYGLEVAGFLDLVENWVEEHQSLIPGYYKLQGGGYSDTFSKRELVAPDDFMMLVQWMRGIGLDDIPYTVWVVSREVDDDMYIDHYYTDEEDQIPEEISFLSPLEAQNYIDYHILNQDDGWRERDIYEDEDGEERLGYWAEKIDPEDPYSDYKHEPFSLEELVIDDRPKMRTQAAITLLTSYDDLPKSIIEEIKSYITSSGSGAAGIKKALLQHYPQYLTKKDLSQYSRIDINDYIKSLSEEEREPYIHQMLDQAFSLARKPWAFMPKCSVCREFIRPDDELSSCDMNLVFHHKSCEEGPTQTTITVCKRMQWRESSHNSRSSSRKGIGDTHSDFRYALHSDDWRVIDNLKDFVRPLPEPLIQELIAMPDRTPLRGKYKESLHETIINLFLATGSDTPAVQRYYEYLLPLWSYELKKQDNKSLAILRDNISINSLGLAIARLGENGRQFIPFMKKRLSKLRHDFGDIIFDPDAEIPDKSSLSYNEIKRWDSAFFAVERYLYIIDAIESGKGSSTRYSFFHPVSHR